MCTSRMSFTLNYNYLNLHITIFLYSTLFHFLQFEGGDIKLDRKVGVFVTMNPGYAGRTELPESVKALFRPVTCIKPDLELICLISLFSDGFLTAKVSLHY